MARFNDDAMAALEEIVSRFGDEPDWIGERVSKIKGGLEDDVDLSAYEPKEKYNNLMKAYTHILMGMNDIPVEDVQKANEESGGETPAEEPAAEEITSIEDIFDD